MLWVAVAASEPAERWSTSAGTADQQRQQTLDEQSKVDGVEPPCVLGVPLGQLVTIGRHRDQQADEHQRREQHVHREHQPAQSYRPNFVLAVSKLRLLLGLYRSRENTVGLDVVWFRLLFYLAT